ncbi:MAG: lytic transglycosylase domain-containing protein [Burkholderiales bacterium]
MSRCSFRVLLFAAALLPGAAAHADMYGLVEGGRVSIVISDTPPADGRYMLFKKGQPLELDAKDGAVANLAGLRYADPVFAAARKTRVEAALIHAVISVESGYNPAARSPAGAVGLMQLMPDTAKRYGVKDRLDPAQNILAGASYLRDLMQLFDNDLKLVLAAYNAGEEAVAKYGNRIPPYRETTSYVPRVLSQYQKLRAGRS